MLAILDTAVVSGLRGELVRVEVDVAPGLPVCHIVGLADTALSEARERVRGAIRNAGFEYPLSRITVNLAPAARRKGGAAYDVAIAVGILVASGQIRATGGPWALLGELSLAGTVLSVPGVLPMVSTLARSGHRRVCVPVADVAEATLVDGVEVVGIEGLDDAARLVAGEHGRRAARTTRRLATHVSGPSAGVAVRPERGEEASRSDRVGGLEPVDLTEVRGQRQARWALEVALAGRHNLLLVGPPGAGKTLLARSVPGLLPPLSDEEAQEVAVIRSICGLGRDGSTILVPQLLQRPFRAPHHTGSYAAMVGGGPQLRPGLVTQAHRGVLFLDELAEFDRDVLDALRQPLEDGTVEIARAHGSVRYPARLQLIAAMNPCRCGWDGDEERACRCPTGDPGRYRQRVSGPLLDRVDIHVAMPRTPSAQLLDAQPGEASLVVKDRIVSAWTLALVRNDGLPNAGIDGDRLLAACALAGPDLRELARIADGRQLTARTIHRVLRVARTIADLAGRHEVAREELLAALSLRDTRFEERTAS